MGHDGRLPVSLGLHRVRVLLCLAIAVSTGLSADVAVHAVAGAAPLAAPTRAVEAPSHLDQAATLGRQGALSVTPRSGLGDGQQVQVRGSGFDRHPAGHEITVMQCAAPLRSGEGCDVSTSRTTELDGAGAFTFQMPVHSRLYRLDGRTTDCRRPRRCLLVAIPDGSELGEAASTRLRFLRDGPLQPLPSLAVTPQSGLSDGQTVHVEGRNFGRRLSDSVRLYRCGTRPSEDSCWGVAVDPISVGDDGRFSADVPAFALFGTHGGTVDCRTAGPCQLVATTDVDYRTPGFLGSPLAGRAELWFATGTSIPLVPEIAVTPTAGLHDVDTLSVHGQGFTAGSRVTVAVCVAGTPRRCDGGGSQADPRIWDESNAENPRSDDAGAFTIDLSAWSRFDDGRDEDGGGAPTAAFDCRRPPGCLVTATDEERGLTAAIPLAFGRPDPPRGRYLDPVFDDVDLDADVAYRRTADYLGNPVELALDIYRPAGDTATDRPAIVLMHGGWFTSGHRADMEDFAREYARRGYVTVSLSYRLRPLTPCDPTACDGLYQAMHDAYEDATAGVEWLRAHAGELGIDPDAIVASGYSAGAVTATNLAYMPGQAGPDRPLVAAAASVSGWFIDPDTPGLPVDVLARTDPGEPPAVVFHGSDDQLLPFGSPADLCPLAQQVDIACTYVRYDGDGHQVGSNMRARGADIVRRTTDFIAEHVLRPQGHLPPR